MQRLFITVLALFATVGATSADEAIDAGEKIFAKNCKACHSVIAGDGTVIFKGGKVGPNLFNVFGRVVGSVEDFKYSKDMAAAAQEGLVWTPELFETYIAKPKDMFKKTKMAFAGLKKPQDRDALGAYLLSVSPDYKPDVSTAQIPPAQ